ncbi:hypothetical protein LJC06_03340 [Bacteroidales bacterium OttesenSCG-928-I14]|nr:hypothetical protein [Bacteroidales bacterium OttesenSCG-928-I14]
MIFIPLIFIAIYLYVRELKISSIVIILFFLTEGFNLIPPEIWETGLGFSKGKDFAFFTLLGIITIDALFQKNYFKTDTLGKYIYIFLAFIVVCILNSKYSIGLPWGEIIRTIRYQFFWMFYFVFMSMDKKELKLVLNCCFYVSIFTALLFILQLVIGDTILVGEGFSKTKIFDMEVKRFYNQPDMLHFFAFMSIYKNPIKNNFKYLAAAILISASFLAFHRSWNSFFIIAICLGYVIMQSKAQKVKIITVVTIIMLPILVFTASNFMKSRTFNDIKLVAQGDFLLVEEFDMTSLEGSTFTFRMAHLFERVLYLNERSNTMLFGGGLVSEDSQNIDKLFDFKIGLIDGATGRTYQVDTSDITYSLLFLRFGYLGSLLYLLLFIYLSYYYYKHRNNRYGYISLLFLILMFGVSFFSDSLLRSSNIIPLLITYCIIKKEEKHSNYISNGLES